MALKKTLLAIHEELWMLKARQCEEKFPFKRGDIITWGGKGLRGRVEEFFPGSFPAVRVVQIRKDGIEGQRRLIRDYDKPRLCNAPTAETTATTKP